MKTKTLQILMVSTVAVVAFASCGKDEELPNCSADFTAEIQRLEGGARAVSSQTSAEAFLNRVDQFEQKWAGEECSGSRDRSQSKDKLIGRNEASRLRDIVRAKYPATTPTATPTPSPTATPSPTTNPSPSPSTTPSTTPSTSPSPKPTTSPATPTVPTQKVIEFFSTSDACTGTASAVVTLMTGSDSYTQCSAQLGATTRWVWSIRVNGVCQDVPDSSMIDACASVQAPGQTHAAASVLNFYPDSDSCRGRISSTKTILHAKPIYDQCNYDRKSGRSTVWSISVDGVCTDIRDTNLESACLAFEIPKIYNPDNAEIVTYNGNSCQGNIGIAGILLPDQDPLPQCKAATRVSRKSKTYSIRVNGTCQNTGETDTLSACLTAFPASKQGRSRIVIFTRDDGCKGDVSYAGYLSTGPTRAQECLALQPNTKASKRKQVYSIEIDGVCKDIPDMKFAEFCQTL